ncbi:MAG: DUF4198 domain-containing protein [Verrucomicrobia bacterium]|nr:DUF4198 domain-containing protein [Verrucomicrobiota bacterium]
MNSSSLNLNLNPWHYRIILMIISRMSAVALTLCLLSAIVPAMAHSIWIETNAEKDGVVIRFGEFDEDYETTPGYLDVLDPLKVYTITDDGEPGKLEFQMFEEGYHVHGGMPENIFVETDFPVMSRAGSPGVHPHFYARYIDGFSKKVHPQMTMDIVPTGNSNEVQVFFKGRPLAQVKLNLYTPEANDAEYVTDEEGKVTVSCDETGLYMLKVSRHREERSGFSRGVFYKFESHNCSLTWNNK